MYAVGCWLLSIIFLHTSKKSRVLACVRAYDAVCASMRMRKRANVVRRADLTIATRPIGTIARARRRFDELACTSKRSPASVPFVRRARWLVAADVVQKNTDKQKPTSQHQPRTGQIGVHKISAGFGAPFLPLPPNSAARQRAFRSVVSVRWQSRRTRFQRQTDRS